MSDPVFQQLVESNRRMTEVFENKSNEIDQRVEQAEAKFEKWRNEKDVIGDPLGYGTMRMNILQGLVSQTRANAAISYGDFPRTDLGTETNVYMHFKTPLNINQHSEMFWFNIRGYSFGSAKIIDETITGYCYAANRVIMNKSAFGNFTPDSYADSAGNVILRILMPSIYYSTVRIDSMRVGNGRLFGVGDLTAKLSLSDVVEFE